MSTRMATRSDAPIIISGSNEPDKMITLTCESCRMALYMAERKLHMPSWKCPSCGSITRL
jgi:predicted RNA-binding Zn-ribbon protein involved in translation (DUF1610 family)